MGRMTGFRHPTMTSRFFSDEEEEQDDDDDNWGNDTARYCIRWEDNMIKNDQLF